MENWRNRSTSPDRQENVFNSRPNTSSARNIRYLQRHQSPNFQTTQNPASSSTSQNAGTRYYGIQRGRRGDFWQLDDLLKLNKKTSSKIIIELSEKLDDFSQLLTSNLEPDWIVLVIAILSKVCSSYFRETKLSVLKVAAINGEFFETLEKYVRILSRDQDGENRDRNKHFWNNPEEFLVNLLFVCESFIDIIPTDCCEILHKLLKVIEFIPSSKEGRPKTKLRIKILMEKLDLRKEGQEQEIETLRVYPTKEEILTSDCKYFVEEKYDDVKLYLDTQVKLCKESFASALRQDIVQCIEYAQDQKFSPIKMYPNIVFQSMEFNCDELGVVVKFSNQEDSDKIFSPRSKCFEWGTVVCFTKDDFCTILLGSVIKKDCKQHHLIIGFEPEYDNYELNVSYTMVQCNAYLYRYYYMQKALTAMSDDDFPLKGYLIDAVPKVELPGYLDSTSSLHLGQGRRVDVSGSNWSSADQLKLDSTQYSAFKAALTQKFVMIQGAPGTGKTYLGLQIVKTLLLEDNQKLWYNKTPILVVCLSNQVLDQFLEGLISTTSRIIRIGLQCKNDKLANFTLTSARTRSYADPNVLGPWKQRTKKMLKEMEVSFDRLKLINNLDYIFNFATFGSIDEKIKTSWFSRASKADIIAWLFDEKGQNLQSLEISEILKNITEEVTHFGSEKGNAVFGEQRNISDEPAPTILWSKFHMWTQIVIIRNQIQKMEPDTADQSKKLRKLETQLKHLWQNYQYFKMKISHRESPSKPKNVDYQSPQRMDPNDRWNLYFHWLNLYTNFVKEKFRALQHEHRQLTQKFTEIQSMLDLEILKGALVLGMTYTAASRLQPVLQSLKCPIVIMEEASKVSEAHIPGSLTKHCENVILFDHDQELFPTAGKSRSTIGINLMERMMRNGMQCHVLRVQHRIRPKMVELLLPHNYPELENHPTVTKIPPILGIPSCYYFVHHEHQDLERYNSKVNLYEVKFLVSFARYLRQVGYQAEDISILSTYTGQSEILCDECEKHEDLLKGVQIGTIGNYPSSYECKIVLLSLVRNNAVGKIGRMKFEDFVIFALSRAKEALYMMGNMDLLCKNSEIWARIKEILVRHNCLGNYLPVCCKVNPDHVTKITEPKDFDGVPEKVCSKKCGRLLNCGHSCSQNCHLLEDDHTATVCTELCSNK